MPKIKILHMVLIGLMACSFSAPAFSQDEEEEKTEKLVAVEMQPLVVSLTKNFRTQGVLMLAYQLFVANSSTAEEVAVRKPQIAAALHQTLTRLSKIRIPADKPVNIPLLDLFMQRSVDELLGKNVAEVVIFSASIQKQ
jgi:flagellar basal body-associated protein FliL